MRRFDWGNGVRRPAQCGFRLAGPVFLTVFILFTAAASAGPAAANSKYAAIVIDANTEEVLFARKADYRRYPASLTKVMTLYMLFEAMEAGKIKLTDEITASKRAAGMPPSKLGLKAGDKITVEKAIEALIVRSANDVACAVGEKLGGAESAFAAAMTKKARSIGMKRTSFRNASGLYDPNQVTTARDMATLAIRIQKDFPQYYHYFKRMKVTWKGRTWPTHNRLMKYFPGADGLKTGYVRASGFNLITSARRGNMHLIGVVMGGRKSRTRDNHMVSLLEQNFAKLLKRPGYEYPLVARLPEVRPKPDFEGMAAERWLAKRAGAMPRPNPFAPDETAEAVIAEMTANAPPEAAEETPEPPASAPPAAVASVEPSPAPAVAAPPAGASTGPELAPLSGGGSGARPAGTGAVPDSVPAPGDAAPPTFKGPPAVTSAPLTAPQTAGPRIAAAPPQPGAGDVIAELIEEGDGQVATEDLAGQIPAADSENAADDAGPQLALLAPSRQWGVQLGAFTDVELAKMHLDNAERLQPGMLTREKSALVPAEDNSGIVYQARFGPMDEAQAKAACDGLRAGGMQCFAIETDDWGRAVRR